MRNLALTWPQAAWLGLGLLAAAQAAHACRRAWVHRMWPALREAAVLSGLYALWQLAGTLSVLGTSGAFARARWIQHLEQTVHLPAEASLQRVAAGHPLLIEASNLYYATMHFGALAVALPWLFLRHREHYGQVRAVLVLITLSCLLVQLIPVAPPRMLPGFIDTAARYRQSVYALGLAPDQLSAMPSVHVAWAVLLGVVVVRLSHSRWRWLALAHPLLTVFVITVTANHFWLDGVVAVGLLAGCVLLQRRLAGGLAARRAPRPALAQLSSDPITRILR